VSLTNKEECALRAEKRREKSQQYQLDLIKTGEVQNYNVKDGHLSPELVTVGSIYKDENVLLEDDNSNEIETTNDRPVFSY